MCSRALIDLFVLLIRETGSGLHSWVHLSPWKNYCSDLVLQVIGTTFVSMVTKAVNSGVSPWGPLGGVFMCMFAYALVSTTSSVAHCHKYKAFLVGGVSSYKYASRLARVYRNAAFSANTLRASSDPDPGQK